MKASLILWACAAALLLTGCRTDPNQVLMENEHRDLEDCNYQLQNELAQCHAQLEASQREVAAMKHGEAAPGPGAVAPPPVSHLPPVTEPTIPKIDLGTPERPDSGPLPEKSFDKSLTPLPGVHRAPDDAPPADGAPALPSGDSSNESRSARVDTIRPASLTSDVERVSLNRWQTGPSSYGAGSGAQGITVSFTPRDTAGHPIDIAGEASIVVIDPAEEGEAKRVARWDFSAPEVTAHYRQSSLGKGLKFDLVWPDAPPKHDDVQLYVRLTTPDGRKLDDTMPLHLKQPPVGDKTAWTKAPGGVKEWIPAAAPVEPVGSDDNGAIEQPAKRLAAAGDRRPTDASGQNSADDTSDTAPVQTAAKHRPVWTPYR